MIIPISTQKLNIGDTVITISDIYEKYYIITPGHEFIIMDYIYKYDNYICVDIDNNIKVTLSRNNITKKVSIDTANKEYTFAIETSEYKKFISKKCPNKSEDYDDREIYDSCKLKNCYNNSCEPKIECAKYLSNVDINKSSVLLKHLRRNKIKELNEYVYIK